MVEEKCCDELKMGSWEGVKILFKMYTYWDFPGCLAQWLGLCDSNAGGGGACSIPGGGTKIPYAACRDQKAKK